VSKDEPPGKQLDKIKTVSLKLTISHPEDAEILEQKGIHALTFHLPHYKLQQVEKI